MSKSDKTEPATPKKKRDSRQKGQLAKSADLTAWFGLLIGLYLIPMTVGRVTDVTAQGFNGIRNLPAHPKADFAVPLLGAALRDGFLAIAPLMIVVGGASMISSMGQTGLLLTLKPLKPDFKRINPKSGFKRLFSVRSLWETGKQIVKITVVLVIAWPRVVDLINLLAGRGRLGLADALPASGQAVLGLTRTIA